MFIVIPILILTGYAGVHAIGEADERGVAPTKQETFMNEVDESKPDFNGLGLAERNLANE